MPETSQHVKPDTRHHVNLEISQFVMPETSLFLQFVYDQVYGQLISQVMRWIYDI
jgi:hypothetical protein